MHAGSVAPSAAGGAPGAICATPSPRPGLTDPSGNEWVRQLQALPEWGQLPKALQLHVAAEVASTAARASAALS